MRMPKTTKTRFQGVYARHRGGCALELGAECSCSPSFYGQVWDAASGRQRKTAFVGSPVEARIARGDLQRDLASGGVAPSRSMRVAEAIDVYMQAVESGRALNKHGRRYKPSAVRDLRGALTNYVKPAVGAKRLGDVRRGDVQGLVDELAGKSGSRVRTVVNAVRSLYAWAQDRELVDFDPAARVRLPAMEATPRDRVATVGEMQGLLSMLDLADSVPFALSAYATARRAEIRHLRVEDVDLQLGVVYLGADDRGRKSRAALRPVPVVRPLAVLIRRRLLERGRPAGDELLCPGFKPGGRNSGLLSFEALQTRADNVWGTSRITSHECRHTCASWLHAAGVLPVIVSQLMGHSTLGAMGGAQITTGRYTHALPGALEEAREQFERYLAAQASKEATG